jgi:predicted component of type VI protein secretion system
MRGRIAFIVVAVLVVAAVAALNWPLFTRPESMSFGIMSASVPLGVTMLVLLGIVLAVFLVSSAIEESRYLLEHRRHTRAMQTQRDLAEKAEASRFTDLRQQLDTHMRESRHRDSIVTTEFEKRLMQSHSELRAQLERMYQMMSTRLEEMEERVGGAREVRVEPAAGVDTAPRDPIRL